MNPHFFIKIRALILLLGLLLFSCQPDSKTSPTGSEYLFALFEDLPEIKELPDPYVMNDGKRVKNKEDWLEHREYLKKLLAHYQYGEMPSRPDNVEVRSIRSARLMRGKPSLKICISHGAGTVYLTAFGSDC